MDPRVRRHAEIVVEHSTRIKPDDEVLVRAPAEAEEFAVALMERIGEIGATASLQLGSTSAERAYRRAMDPEDFETPQHKLAAAEAADVVIGIRADANTFETSDVSPETNQARGIATQPVSEAVMSKRWCGTQYPAPGNAQAAEMSTAAYADFVYDAIDKDWDEQREFQAQMVELLDAGDEVRIVSGDTTDLTMRTGDNPTQNDYGEHNLPGGEVFTAPIPDSVEGEVLFDMPVMVQGRELTGVWLRFEDGEVVDHDADSHPEVLESLLDTDEGASRLGELGVGMNRDIDRFTYNMLFDEKMGDTIHLAVGRAYEDTVTEDAERNDSAVHQDMIVDMSEDSRIEIDGETVQRNGTFVFEDDF